VAQIAVRTVHELLKADAGGHVDTVVFNGVVDTTDPGTGLRVRPCLVTLRTTRDVFSELDLAHVQPLACLKHLSAAVSKSPAELVPVRPVLEFRGQRAGEAVPVTVSGAISYAASACCRITSSARWASVICCGRWRGRCRRAQGLPDRLAGPGSS
jgi:hypothetical protein